MEFMDLGLKSLSFYASMALYALSVVYALVLLAPMISPRERVKGDRLHKKKPSQYSMDDILELSAQADAYEMIQEPFTAQYMADLADQIAQQYELSEEDREALRIAVLLHDVGQIEQCDFIQEERALRPEERQELENHPLAGYQFVKEMGPEYEKAALWVRWSHERWDGTGYPDGLMGEQIPIPARILAVVDAYCAMMQDRPYRAALSQEMAVYELRKYAGARYDPQMVQLFEAEGTPHTTALEVI
ncbi:MAG: HD-GYP domain-containing protein [Candidatus Sericytochromatia bacterium]